MEKLITIKGNAIYFIPFYDLIQDDYQRSSQPSLRENIRIIDVPETKTHTISFHADFPIEEDSIVSQAYS